MKSMILVALALVAVAAAAPVEQPIQILVLRNEFEQQPEGAYRYSFELDNGSNREEQGEVREALDEEGKIHKVVVVRGSYSYPSENGGTPISITYYADENGFHAEGESIPKSATR